MFEQTLENKFKAIFKMKNVSFAQPGESQEQECLFVDVAESVNNVKDGIVTAKISGSAYIFGNADKLPFGFFSKCIKQAGSLGADFYFHDLESNTKTYGNIVQRGFSFVYFFSAQYDPEMGNITEIDISFAEES